MKNAELWWIDNYKQLHIYKLDNHYPPEINIQGRLYLVIPSEIKKGWFDAYDLGFFPNKKLSDITSINDLGTPIEFFIGDMRYAHSYDVLRRSGWFVTHLNIVTGIRDNPKLETLDPDLVITQNELKDLSNALCFVDGVFHKTTVDKHTNEMYVYDGCQTLRNAGKHSDVTLLDFSPVGGCSLYPIIEEVLITKEDLPKTICLDIAKLNGYKGESLKNYTMNLIVDGVLYSPGKSTRSVNDTVVEIQISKLDLIRNFLKSPLLRNKPIPLPDYSNSRKNSDSHDDYLDVFVNNIEINNDTVKSNEWILSRLLSRHSSVVLIPKSVVSIETPLYKESDSGWWEIFPSKKTKLNSLLSIGLKRFSPLFLHTDGYRDRTLLPVPYREDRTLQSVDDPLGAVIANPNKDIRDPSSVSIPTKITQWCNLPLLGELK